jgi:hypothetical protein
LITATDLPFRVKSNLKNSLKSISISTRKQLCIESFATNESGVAKIKTLQQIPFYPFSFSKAMLWFLIPTGRIHLLAAEQLD